MVRKFQNKHFFAERGCGDGVISTPPKMGIQNGLKMTKTIFLEHVKVWGPHFAESYGEPPGEFLAEKKYAGFSGMKVSKQTLFDEVEGGGGTTDQNMPRGKVYKNIIFDF